MILKHQRQRENHFAVRFSRGLVSSLLPLNIGQEMARRNFCVKETKVAELSAIWVVPRKHWLSSLLWDKSHFFMYKILNNIGGV